MVARMHEGRTGTFEDGTVRVAGFVETKDVVEWLENQQGINCPLDRDPDPKGFILRERRVKLYTPATEAEKNRKKTNKSRFIEQII